MSSPDSLVYEANEFDFLLSIFTQNIDTLETIAGIPASKIIEAHGSFGSAECLRCRTAYTTDDIRPQIQRGEVVRCERAGCDGKKGALIKPKITFFGEGLPKEFFDRLSVSRLLIPVHCGR